MSILERCYKCDGDQFYRNDSQVRCAACGGFHCRPEEYRGKLLTPVQVDALQRGLAKKNQANRAA